MKKELNSRPQISLLKSIGTTIGSRLDGQHIRDTCLSNVRIPIYSCLIIVCSLIGVPDDYKIDKRNILNMWFVKIGWFWTSTLMLPLVFASIKTDNKQNVSLAIFRVILSTLLWYLSVNLFQFIDDMTGFDISGHTFLLTFSNLLITSEMRHSEKLDELVNVKTDTAISAHHIRLPLMLLSSLWDFMLLQTALFYHTILQKSIALVWAIGSWYLVHTIFYERVPKREDVAISR